MVVDEVSQLSKSALQHKSASVKGSKCKEAHLQGKTIVMSLRVCCQGLVSWLGHLVQFMALHVLLPGLAGKLLQLRHLVSSAVAIHVFLLADSRLAMSIHQEFGR